MADDAAARPALFDASALRRIFHQLQTTDVDELEIVVGASRLYLRRDPQILPYTTREAAPQEEAAGVVVVAPLTGVFYARPSPEQPPFVHVGEHIEAGHVVALIETMKLFNEVVTDVAGEVVEILALDGDLVESGQEIVRIIPGAGDAAPPPVDTLESAI